MRYAIMVRPIGNPDVQELVAYDIDDRTEATQLASGLAASYRTHGAYVDADAFWFGDESGLHELWVEAV